MMLVRIPPGGKAEPHSHDGFEAGIYIFEDKVDNLYGASLKESIVTEKGDFLFIPPGVPHQPINLSDTEPALISDERLSTTPYLTLHRRNPIHPPNTTTPLKPGEPNKKISTAIKLTAKFFV